VSVGPSVAPRATEWARVRSTVPGRYCASRRVSSGSVTDRVRLCYVFSRYVVYRIQHPGA